MSSSNLWDLYTLDNLDDDRVNEDYVIGYDEIEDGWPEYEIAENDIVLNKDALLAIKLAQPLNSEFNDSISSSSISSIKQQKKEGGESENILPKEAQSVIDKEKDKANNLISNNNNNAQQVLEGNKSEMYALHQKSKGSYIITVDDDELLIPLEAAAAQAATTQSIGEIEKARIITADDTLTILLITCKYLYCTVAYHPLFILFNK